MYLSSAITANCLGEEWNHFSTILFFPLTFSHLCQNFLLNNASSLWQHVSGNFFAVLFLFWCENPSDHFSMNIFHVKSFTQNFLCIVFVSVNGLESYFFSLRFLKWKVVQGIKHLHMSFPDVLCWIFGAAQTYIDKTCSLLNKPRKPIENIHWFFFLFFFFSWLRVLIFVILVHYVDHKYQVQVVSSLPPTDFHLCWASANGDYRYWEYFLIFSFKFALL